MFRSAFLKFTAIVFLFNLSAPLSSFALKIPKEIAEGRKYFEKKEYINSKEQYEMYLHKVPADAPFLDETLLMIGKNLDYVARKVKDPYFIRQQRDMLSKLINKYPESIHIGEAYIYLGQSYGGFSGVELIESEIDYQRALNYLESAYRKSRDKSIKAKAMFMMGQIYQKMELNFKAKEYYLALIDIFPNSELAKEASQLLKDIAPEYDVTKINLVTVGKQLLDGGEYDLALLVFERAIKKYPDTERAHYSLMMKGVCYLWLKRMEDAENTLRQAYRQYRNSKGETDFYLAFLLERRNKVLEAKKFYKIASGDADNYKWVIRQSKRRLENLKRNKK